MSMDLPERDGDGYLVSMADWTPEIGRAMAEADGVEVDRIVDLDPTSPLRTVNDIENAIALPSSPDW